MANEPHGNRHSGWEAWGSGDLEARGKAVGDSGERYTGCGDLRIAKALALQAHGQVEDGQYLDEVLSRLNSFP